jgi:2-polyprenyl-6-methoxyphenol hydroxylase-like FAD-dependent oxidoreductase
MKVLIVGGGIGGLAAAIALRKVGVEVAVFERAPAFGAVGAGITLWTNAIRALEKMGAGEAVCRAAAPVERGEVRTWRGKLISELAIGEISRSMGAPTVAIHRADLHSALLSLLPSEVIRPASEGVGFSQSADGVVVRFKDGREEKGDLLVAADGIRSALRAQILGDAPLRYSGYVGWQTASTIPGPLETPGQWRIFVGRGSQFGIVPIGPGRVYWFGTLNLARGAVVDSGGRKAELARIFEGWASPIPDLVRAADEASIIRTELSDRDPARKWGEGRVTMLGDAVHPMTPNVGQGGCQAIEDAVRLARALKDGPDPVGALRAYESARRERTAHIVLLARRAGGMLQWEGDVACALRNWLWRWMPRAIELARLRRLLGVEIPDL